MTAELRAEIEELKPNLVELLHTEGVETIDDPEEESRKGMRTVPRSAAELNADTRLQKAAAARRRQYQGGTVNVIFHDGLTPEENRNSLGRHMELLVRESNHRKAVERGDVPPEGRYVSKWNLFG